MLRPAWLLAFLDRSDQTLGVNRRRRLHPSFPQRRSLPSRVGYDYTVSLERYGDRTFTGWIVALTGCALHKPRDPSVAYHVEGPTGSKNLHTSIESGSFSCEYSGGIRSLRESGNRFV